MTPLDRAARAVEMHLQQKFGAGIHPGPSPTVEIRGVRVNTLNLARAVIAAIRLSSPSQDEAVGVMLEREGMYMDCAPADVWKAMIDALLAEGE